MQKRILMALYPVLPSLLLLLVTIPWWVRRLLSSAAGADG